MKTYIVFFYGKNYEKVCSLAGNSLDLTCSLYNLSALLISPVPFKKFFEKLGIRGDKPRIS